MISGRRRQRGLAQSVEIHGEVSVSSSSSRRQTFESRDFPWRSFHEDSHRSDNGSGVDTLMREDVRAVITVGRYWFNSLPAVRRIAQERLVTVGNPSAASGRCPAFSLGLPLCGTVSSITASKDLVKATPVAFAASPAHPGTSRQRNGLPHTPVAYWDQYPSGAPAWRSPARAARR